MSTPNDPWVVVEYEVKLFWDLYAELDQEKAKDYTDLVQNALCESLCLHTRILVDICLGDERRKGEKGKDDITLNLLVPGFTHPAVARLNNHYGKWDIEHSPCWVLNKLLAHPTTKRINRHDYTSVINGLVPLLEEVLTALYAARNGSRVAKHDATQVLPRVNPNLCASTASYR